MIPLTKPKVQYNPEVLIVEISSWKSLYKKGKSGQTELLCDSSLIKAHVAGNIIKHNICHMCNIMYLPPLKIGKSLVNIQNIK